MSRRRPQALVLALALAVHALPAAGDRLPPSAPAPAPATAPASAPDAASLGAAVGLRQEPAPQTDRRTARWGWPLTGRPEIVNGFDPPAQRWLAGHRGIDLAGVAGEPVLAVEAGVVSFSGVVAGTGVLSIRHADGLLSTYQPVDDRLPRGSRVARGDPVAVLDAGGHCLLLDCLHLGARRGRDTYLDPTPLLHPVVLTLVPPGSG